MNWPKKLTFNFVAAVAFGFCVGCGVKGDPLPPDKPAELGRGRPTYKRATEEIKIQKNNFHKAPVKDDKSKEDSDDDDRE